MARDLCAIRAYMHSNGATCESAARFRGFVNSVDALQYSVLRLSHLTHAHPHSVAPLETAFLFPRAPVVQAYCMCSRTCVHPKYPTPFHLQCTRQCRAEAVPSTEIQLKRSTVCHRVTLQTILCQLPATHSSLSDNAVSLYFLLPCAATAYRRTSL